jgi:hypothetical protein
MVAPEAEDKNRILSLSFNQDQSCFSCGTERGFRVYHCLPYKDTFERIFDGGIGLVTMLYRTNIMALVGGGRHPKFPPNKVMLWDDNQTKCIGELSFKSSVKAVQLSRERIVVVLEQRIYVYNFSNLKLMDAVDTCGNPSGLCALGLHEPTILVTPTKQIGYIRIANYSSNVHVERNVSDVPLAALVMTQDARLCAVASVHGTVIKIFSTADGSLLQEMRRGADKAIIHNLAFDRRGRWLACTSDRGTVHIFSTAKSAPQPLAEEQKVQGVKNPTSIFKFLKAIVPYFGAERSFAQFRIPTRHAIVAFAQALTPTPDGQCQIIGRLFK